VWGNWLAHNPVSPVRAARALAALTHVSAGAAVAAWGGHLVLMAWAGGLALAAYGAGSPVRGWLSSAAIPGAGVMAVAVGAGVLGLGVLGLGMSGLAFRGVGWAVTAAAGLAGAWTLRGAVGVPSCRWMVRMDTWPWTAVLGLSLAIALLGALAPEVSFDALAHHLAHPQVYAAAHKVVGLPHHFMAQYPALLEMNYLLAFLLGGGAPLAKLIHFGWGLVALVALVGWAREIVEDRWALAAAAGFMLLPYVQVVFMWAYVDLGAAATLTLALRAASLGPAGAALAGTLAGLSMGTKATGVFAPLLALAVLSARRPARRHWAALTACCAALALPWGIKNWAVTGNPIAPFGSRWIQTLWWGPDNQARYAAELTSYATRRPFAVETLLGQPWRTSVLNEGVLDSMAGMSAWFLWAFPLLTVMEVAGARLPAFAALGYFLLWLFVPRQARYLLPAWPVATLATILVLRALARRGGLALVPVWAAAGLLVVHLALAFDHEHFIINPEPVVFGAETPDQYLARGLPEKPYCIRMSRVLKERFGQERILVVSQYGLALLWGGHALTQSVFDTPLIERWATDAADAAGMARAFRQAGVAHVLYSMTGGFTIQNAYRMYGFTPAAAARWRAFWTSRAAVELNQDDRYLVVRFDGRPGSQGLPGVVPGLDEQWLAPTDAAVLAAEQSGTVAAALPAACEAYARIAAATGSAGAFERLGTMRLRQGDFSGARQALLEAEGRGRNTAVLHDALGVIEAHRDDPAAAVTRFRRALTLDPGQEDARRNLAQVLWHLGNRGAALGVVREGLALNPDAGDLTALLASWAQGAPPAPR